MLGRFIGVGAVAGLLAAGLTAGPGTALTSSKTTPTITLSSSDPALGATIHFANTYPNGTRNPADEVNCYQGGTLVWGEILSISQEQAWGFTLGGSSSPWVSSGGSATCYAELISVTFKARVESITVLATDPFTASG